MQKEGSEVNTREKSLEAMSRQEVEDFLYKEGYLLDDWQLDEWLSLFTPDAQYVVPTNDLPEADPENDLVYIDHDSDRILRSAREKAPAWSSHAFSFESGNTGLGGTSLRAIWSPVARCPQNPGSSPSFPSSAERGGHGGNHRSTARPGRSRPAREAESRANHSSRFPRSGEFAVQAVVKGLRLLT